MSRLVSQSISGGLHEATAYVNKRGLSKSVLTMQQFENMNYCTVVFKVNNYAAYVKLCGLIGVKPIEQDKY